MSIEEAKGIAQIVMPLMIAVIIPYFRRMNQQLQELNKQMAISGAAMEYITKELERIRERVHKTENAVQKAILVQERCRGCNPD